MTSETLQQLPSPMQTDLLGGDDENQSATAQHGAGSTGQEEADHDSGVRHENRSSQAIDRALSWEQARKHIRVVLEDYMKTSPPKFRKNHLESEGTSPRFLFLWKYDIDFYAAALPASFALLALACVSFTSRQRGYDDSALNARADLDVYKYQIAAASLLLSGTLFSIILTRRRSDTCTQDSDVAKRHTILEYLLAMKKMDQEDPLNRSLYSGETPGVETSELHSIPLSGTSLTDIYPTYRRSVSEASAGGSWHQIPTLLLVKGDYISLQIGDIAPAKCKMVDSGSSGQNSSSVMIGAGERLALESLGKEAASALSALPRGRSTLPPNSRNLLTLCNNMRIFVLQETPLEDFLRLPPVEHHPPQLHRQIKVVRSVLFLLAVVIFITTIAIIFLRPYTGDRDLSIILPLPLLAALGVLPVTTPVCAFFLEVLGTTRVLVAVDPYASTRAPLHDDALSVTRKSSEKMLFLRYFFATVTSRLSLQEPARRFRFFFRRCSKYTSRNIPALGLVHVPPASTYLLEKLGVATAFALVDDELACEPHSSPQQLLIPSGKGLKLLDLCRTYEGEFEDETDSDKSPGQGRKGKKPGYDSDSDSDEEQQYQHISLPRRKLKALRLGYRKKVTTSHAEFSSNPPEDTVADENEVQFEDPLWWQHLPSLKCIGLACLLVDHRRKTERESVKPRVPSFVSLTGEKVRPDSSERDGSPNPSRHSSEVQALAKKSQENQKRPSVTFADDSNTEEDVGTLDEEIKTAEKALTNHVCSERSRSQLQSLARCIGFSAEGNTFGHRGDLSPFRELLRLQVVSTRLLRERLVIDAHALGLEQSRSWGELTFDSTSVIVQDRRSRGYQLLTVGNPRIVTELCQEAWQGENSTILPLSTTDKKIILDTSSSWSLADLDVAAFCYAPVPHTFDQRIGGVTKRHASGKTEYLVDNTSQTESPHSISVSEDWSLIKNQIFLGVLGSSVIPRKEIEPLIDVVNDAGVRFVYFSPRNMRRTKELASAVGIDVAWNCAISLRPLDEGEDDPHRMTSTYADWDVNAKLPHGIDDVRHHLKEVDNVPLLVSLFTDVTKDTTKEMVKTFQDYSDTVIAMGLSHLPRNTGIFAASDLSIGADVLTEKVYAKPLTLRQLRSKPPYTVLPYEVAFVSSISAHSCAFNLRGASSTSLMPFIIERGRAALDAATSAALFVISGCVSFSLYILFCTCAASTTIPFVPTLGSVLYLQIVLPLIGLAMAMSDSDSESMKRVPRKNDQSETFARNEGKRLYINAFFKALAPAVFPQLLYLIAFGELLVEFEPELVLSSCSLDGKNIEEIGWVSLVRCDGLKEYSGVARTSAGSLMLAEMVLCVVVASSSFVYRAIPIQQEPPWRRNNAWVYSVLLAIGLVAVFLVVVLEDGTFAALPWYFSFLALLIPFICLFCAEAVKSFDSKHVKRAVTLRRLQFETRLGMWSPK